MHPVLFRIGPVTLHTYGVLVAAGVLLGLWLARRQARDGGKLDPDRVWNLGVYLVLAAIGGAKLWLVVADWQYYAAHPREIFSLATLQAAGVYYGGVLTAIVVILLYARRAGLGFLPLLDVYSPGLSLGHAIGRLGCFSAGCCWGRQCALPWGVTFQDPYAHELVGVPLGVPLHPTQLYEAAAEFLILAFLLWLARRQQFTGQLFALYAVLYGALRLTTEFFRGDPGRTVFFGGGVSLMQVVSVGLILLGAWLWWRGIKRRATQA